MLGLGSDDHGKYTERIEYGQENIHEKSVKLYSNENNQEKAQGELIVTIECAEI